MLAMQQNNIMGGKKKSYLWGKNAVMDPKFSSLDINSILVKQLPYSLLGFKGHHKRGVANSWPALTTDLSVVKARRPGLRSVCTMLMGVITPE